MRPLLGTYVQVEATATDPEVAERAVTAAFQRIEVVQRAMSFHDPDSELSRLNREAGSRTVSVSADTWEVLRRACQLAQSSGGCFDPCIAGHLVNGALLPRPDAPEPDAHGCWRDILLDDHDGAQVRFARPLWLDLGGIAKGYAVDMAIETLAEHDIEFAQVNAGGDLRVLRRRADLPPAPLYVRAPSDAHRLISLGELPEGAVASSGERVLGRPGQASEHSPLVDPVLGVRPAQARSITVIAPECWLADGMTKIVGLLGQQSQAILEQHACHAAIIETDGQIHASPGFWQAVNRPHPPGEPFHA